MSMNIVSVIHKTIIPSTLFLLFFFPMSGDARNAPWHEHGRGKHVVSSWMKELEASLRIRSHPVRKAIVCNLPFANLSVDVFAQTIMTSVPRLEQAITVLERFGLAARAMNEGGDKIIAPANEIARDTMCRWAQDWCKIDTECSTLAPFIDPQ